MVKPQLLAAITVTIALVGAAALVLAHGSAGAPDTGPPVSSWSRSIGASDESPRAAAAHAAALG